MKEYSNGDYHVMYDNDVQAATFSNDSKSRIIRPKVSDIYSRNIDSVALWGDGNDFPQQVYKDLGMSANLSQALDTQARLLTSGGLKFRFIDPIDDTAIDKGEINRKVNAEISEFISNSWFYPIHAARNFYTFINVFPQMQLQADFKKIRKLYVRDAAQCRLALQNEIGEIPEVYVNANWPDCRYDDKETIRVPFLDSVLAHPDDLRAMEVLNVIDYLYYPTGQTYYQLAGWNGIRENGIYEISVKIPQWKMALMDGQITPRFHIQFPDYYWTMKFGKEYEEWKEPKKAQKRKEEFLKITNVLKGIKNAGKNIATTYRTDVNTGKEFPGVKIEEIGNKFTDGMWLADATDALINMYNGVGLDPSMAGITPGGGATNRSGSDKREAFNLIESLLTPHHDIILHPYNFASAYNGWNTEYHKVEFFFNNPVMQTLDQVTTKNRSTRMPDVNEPTN